MSDARDEMFALIARIPGSGTADWCDDARRHLDAHRAEVLREAADVADSLPDHPDHYRLNAAWKSGARSVGVYLRRMADEGEPCPDIHHGLTRPHATTECPKDGDPS